MQTPSLVVQLAHHDLGGKDVMMSLILDPVSLSSAYEVA